MVVNWQIVGVSCSDIRGTYEGKTCAQLLQTSANKTNLCDHPIVSVLCCQTRKNVCKGYHWITHSEYKPTYVLEYYGITEKAMNNIY